jgi:hypothetical protein
MNKTYRHETAARLSKALEQNAKQTDALLGPAMRTDLLTTQEIDTKNRLDEEYTLLAIESETFFADFRASRNPIMFLKRNIFKNR